MTTGSDALHPRNSPVSNHGRKFEHCLDELFAEVNAFCLVLNRAVQLEYGGGELSGSVNSILRILERSGPQTVPQIARARSTSRQNIQILINRLAEEGCVEMAANPAHKRSVLVALTEQGKNLSLAVEQQRTKLAARLTAQAGPEELQSIVHTLRRFRELLAREGEAGDRNNPPAASKAKSRTKGADLALGVSDEPLPSDMELPVALL